MLIMEKLFFSLLSGSKFPLLCLLVHLSSLSVCPALECEPEPCSAFLLRVPCRAAQVCSVSGLKGSHPLVPLLRSPVQLCPAPQGAAGLLPPSFPWGSLGTLAQVSFRSGRTGPGLHHWEQSLCPHLIAPAAHQHCLSLIIFFFCCCLEMFSLSSCAIIFTGTEV